MVYDYWFRFSRVCPLSGFVDQDAVAAVVAAIDHREGVVLFLVAEGEEGMANQVHLQDGFLHSNSLERTTW